MRGELPFAANDRMIVSNQTDVSTAAVPGECIVIGQKLRVVRLGSGRSLADVAAKVGLSVATLSRIETGKQSVDAETVVQLAEILGIAPVDLFGAPAGGENGRLARAIASMDSRDRAALWREVSEERKPRRLDRAANAEQFSYFVEELLAHFDLMREELETLQKKVAARRR